jgi:hypothetical protein
LPRRFRRQSVHPAFHSRRFMGYVAIENFTEPKAVWLAIDQ